jgi:hypothetical protein
LNALLIGKPNQSMGVERIRGSFDSVEGKMDSFSLADRNHLGVELLRIFPTAKLLDAIFLAADPLFWHLRVELKREPTDLHWLIDSCDGLFEPSFAD